MAKDSTLVLAFFDTKDEADAAAKSMKDWDKASDDVKLGAIGVLVKNEKGKVKSHMVGARSGGPGAKTGIILGVIAAILSGGITLLGGVAWGAIGGGLAGSLFHKGLKLSPDDIDRMNAELDAGHAAVGLMVDPAEAAATTAELTALGGRTNTLAISGEVMESAEQTAAAEPAEAAMAAPAEPTEGAVAEAAEVESAVRVGATGVAIGTVHYSGREFVEIMNNTDEEANLGGWVLRDKNKQSQAYTFAKGTHVAAGKSLRLYTEPGHPYTFDSKTSLWNNQGDELELLDSHGKLIDGFAYGSYAREISLRGSGLPQLTRGHNLAQSVLTVDTTTNASGEAAPTAS